MAAYALGTLPLADDATPASTGIAFLILGVLLLVLLWYLASVYGKPSYKRLIEEGGAAFKAGKYKEALAAATKSLEEKKTAAGFALKSRALYMLHRYDEAIAANEQVIAIGDDKKIAAQALRLRAAMHRYAKQEVEAELAEVRATQLEMAQKLDELSDTDEQDKPAE